MKKLFMVIVFSLFLMVSTANAWQLTWDASIGEVDGYLLSYGLVDGIVTEIDIEDVTSYDLAPLGLTIGKRYEFFLKAYNNAGNSGESDHVRWTYQADPIIIEMLSAPISIIINP